MKTRTWLIALVGALFFGPKPVCAQHGHLEAGAAGVKPGDRLLWANAADFVASSGYIKTLNYTNGGRYAGYFEGGITLTALPATAANAGPDPTAAAPGAFLQFRLTCLEGPAGGRFGFWEAGATQPNEALAPGQMSTNLWPLSEGVSAPGADPYGHRHGRRFSASLPGIYKVGFTVVDTSTQGLDGKPIHAPSEDMPVWFQAGVNVGRVSPHDDHAHVQFGALAGVVWQLEASDSLSVDATWRAVGAPVTGNDTLVEVEDDRPPVATRYFRVRSAAAP
jgi:hypothetical protein